MEGGVSVRIGGGEGRKGMKGRRRWVVEAKGMSKVAKGLLKLARSDEF